MNWKNLPSAVLEVLGFCAVFTLLWCFQGKLHFSPYLLVVSFVAVIAMSLGNLGSMELNRGGHSKDSRILNACFIVSLTVPFILIFTKTAWVGAYEIWFASFCAIVAAELPCAYFLNRRQKKACSRPTINNAS